MKRILINLVAADVSRLIIALKRLERTHVRCYTLGKMDELRKQRACPRDCL
jgi:hypothetical protein